MVVESGNEQSGKSTSVKGALHIDSRLSTSTSVNRRDIAWDVINQPKHPPSSDGLSTFLRYKYESLDKQEKLGLLASFEVPIVLTTEI
jgi:hypothetical protein